MKKYFSKYGFWFLVGLLFLSLRLPSLFEPYWYGDEGIYLVLGQAIKKGLVLYTQIHDNKPPTLYYLAAIGQTVFGFRFLLMLAMIPTVYFFHRLALKFLSQKLSRISTIIFVILTSIPWIEGNIANAEVFMLLPTILGVLYFINPSRLPHYFFSGLFFGLAFTIKVPVAFEVLALCLYFLMLQLGLLSGKISFKFSNLLDTIGKIFTLGIGFILPILIYGIYFASKSALPQFLNASLFQNIGYLSSWSTGTYTASPGSGGLTVRLIWLLVSFAALGILTWKKIITKKQSMVYFWFAGAVFGSLLSGRPYPHYLIQVLPPFCILIFFFGKNILTSVVNIIALLILVFAVFRFNFYFYPTISYYQNFYSYIFGKKSLTDYYHYFGNSVNTTYQVADYIKIHTGNKDRVFVWGDEPYVYALADRLPATKYTVAYHIIDFHAHELTMNQLKAHLPKIIVYYGASGRDFPQLDSFLNKYYYLNQSIGSALIFEKR